MCTRIDDGMATPFPLVVFETETAMNALMSLLTNGSSSLYAAAYMPSSVA